MGAADRPPRGSGLPSNGGLKVSTCVLWLWLLSRGWFTFPSPLMFVKAGTMPLCS